MNNKPLISIVTISFNQAEYLEECILSIIEQDYPNIEYIICDPGSTDGSRDIIEKYRDKIAHIIYDKDKGPADGLNNGFEKATGEIYGYLNSDDVLMPYAINSVIEKFNKMKNIDVIYGHGYFIDKFGHKLRKSFSDTFSKYRMAYGASVIIQPSTFFKSNCFKTVSGFNNQNKINWDTELLIDMSMAGFNFKKVNLFLSGYRLYPESITCDETNNIKRKDQQDILFTILMKRKKNRIDELLFIIFRFYKHLSGPSILITRILKGSVIDNSKK